MLKRMKSVFVLAAVGGLMAAGLAGFGRPGHAPRASSVTAQAKAAPDKPQPDKKKIRIGVTVPAADHGWTAGVGWWAKRAMKLYPAIDWGYTTSPHPDKQI